MKIIEFYPDTFYPDVKIYTIEVEENVLIDVRVDENIYTFIPTDDGGIAYDYNGNSFDYYYNALEIIDFLKKTVTKSCYKDK